MIDVMNGADQPYPVGDSIYRAAGPYGLRVLASAAFCLVVWAFPSCESQSRSDKAPNDITNSLVGRRLHDMGADLRRWGELTGPPGIQVAFAGKTPTFEALELLEGLPAPAYLVVRDTHVEAAAFRALRDARNVYGIRFQETDVTDETLTQIGALAELRDLDLMHASVTDEGLKCVVGIPGLRNLRLEHTGITDASLRWIAEASALSVLEISSTEVSDSGLLAIQGKLPNLRRLMMADTAVSDLGLAALAGRPVLKELNIASTCVTNEGLRFLQDCQELNLLVIVDTAITDTGLAELASLRYLSSVVAFETAVTREGAERALPQAFVQVGPLPRQWEKGGH